MFTKELNHLTLTNDVADRLFDNITADGYGLDKSFTATLRAVLYNRLPAGESVDLAFVPLGHHVNSMIESGADILMKEVAGNLSMHETSSTYSIYVVYTSGGEQGGKILDIVRSSAGRGRKYLKDHTLIEELRVFYIKMFDGLFFTDNNSTVIFLKSLDIRIHHALQMMIPKYLPGLFSGMPLAAEEMDLLKSLGNKGHAEYLKLIEMFAERFDMRAEIIRSRLKGFETAYERIKVREVTNTISRLEQEYRFNLEKLNAASKQILDQQIVLAGLKSRMDCDGTESELMEYFLCNKNLSLIRVDGTELEFVVHGYADVFDESAFETCAKNPDSYLYKSTGSLSQMEMELLYRAIFDGGIYKLRICAAYRVNMQSSIVALTNYIFPPESKDYLPNPHIQRHGCIGSYAARFKEFMKDRDYVGAIDQAVVSARNLNFFDSTVMSAFASNLSQTTIKCIEDRHGNTMTPKAAIAGLTAMNTAAVNEHEEGGHGEAN